MSSNDAKSLLEEDVSTVSTARSDKSKIYLWIFILFSFMILIIGFVIGYFINSGCGSIYNFQYEKMSSHLQNSVRNSFLKEQLELYSSKIHQAGSDQNLNLAERMSTNWKRWGVQSSQLFKYPVNATVNNEPAIIRLLFNGNIVTDFPTVELNGTLPRYHSYSIGGRAQGRFVFINYGLRKDLMDLRDLKVEFCGKNIIAIVRLGHAMRGAKVRNIVKECGDNFPGGLLVYPDPWDYAVDSNNKSSWPNNTAVYPETWWLPDDAAVFGNMKMKPGLQSPDLPSFDGIFNSVDISTMLTPFPVQPISYGDAAVIFSHMNGTKVPSHWSNCLPTHLESQDKYEIEMVINNSIAVKTMVNVIGYIPGSVEKDRYVILGNHRDAWAFGASDPGSGTVILQQVVSILADAFKKKIFRPSRTIIFASWDGEEEGLLGSTEFTSQFATDLAQRCVAYVNMDCPIKGSWSFSGRSTPLLVGPMIDSSKNVLISSHLTLFEDWRNKNPLLPEKREPKVKDLGGGSDHNLFAYVLGIPSAYPEYAYNQSLPSMPTYHTQYDNIDLMSRVLDPQLNNHALLSKFVIDYVIRLSSSPIIPYSVDRLSHLLLTKYSVLKKAIETSINDTDYTAVLYKQLVKLSDTSTRFMDKLQLRSTDLLKDPLKLRSVNDLLLQLPRMFITRDGLPTRPNLRNILLSTRLTNSYRGSVFTGVLDALDLYRAGRIQLADVLRQMSLLSNCLRNAINVLEGGLVNTF